MGMVVRFPLERAQAVPPAGELEGGGASIIVLPVVRIEREAASGPVLKPSAPSGGKRRRARRS